MWIDHYEKSKAREHHTINIQNKADNVPSNLYHELENFGIAYMLCLGPILFIIVTNHFIQNNAEQKRQWIARGRNRPGHEVLAIGIAFFLVQAVIHSVVTRLLVGTSYEQFGLLISPIVFALVIAAVLWFTQDRHSLSSIRAIQLAAIAWVLGMPIVIMLQLVCSMVLIWLGSTPAIHPLVNLNVNGVFSTQLLFILSASVASPLLEEVLFRGLLMRWAIQRIDRCWILNGIAGCMALVLATGPSADYRPLLFWACIIVLFILLLSKKWYRHWPRRTILGILSSSLLFAVAHGNVWPTPIPLLLLGTILGYLTARTGSIFASFLLHATFNLVACIIVLRQTA